jgi:CPA2 family monovalent cation:H+ antiporter-2
MGVKLGLGLSSISEFGFELAGIAAITMMSANTPVFSSGLFSFIITVIALSMITTPYFMVSSSRVAQFLYEIVKKLPKSMRKDFFNRKLEELEKVPAKRVLENHIIIIGGGTVGRGLAKALMKNNQVLVVDHDPEVVAQGQRDGLPYVYGSSENETLWERLDLGDAKLMVITILNHREALAILREAKELCPKLTIFSIAHYYSNALDFYNKGVDFVAMPSVMGSNIFLENIYTFLGSGAISTVQSLKNEYLEYLKEQVAEEKKYHSK